MTETSSALGLTGAVDPASGRAFKVESGSSHYGIDTQGRIAGADFAAQPDVNVRQLVQLP